MFFISLLTVSYSCEEKFDGLDFKKTKPTIVIEGLITDAPPPYHVKLSLSTSFDDSLISKKINNARVVISDDSGNSEQLTLVNDGLFECSNITGKTGSKYFLEVEYNHEIYLSETKMLPVHKFDSIVYSFEKKGYTDSSGYYVSAFISRPTEETYTKVNIYRNDSLFNGIYDLLIYNHEIFDALSGYEFEYPFHLFDTVKIEFLSLTEEVFDYFKEVTLNNLYSYENFLNYKKNPPSNISNGALGYFSASSIYSKKFVIKEKEFTIKE